MPSPETVNIQRFLSTSTASIWLCFAPFLSYDSHYLAAVPVTSRCLDNCLAQLPSDRTWRGLCEIRPAGTLSRVSDYPLPSPVYTPWRAHVVLVCPAPWPHCDAVGTSARENSVKVAVIESTHTGHCRGFVRMRHDRSVSGFACDAASRIAAGCVEYLSGWS